MVAIRSRAAFAKGMSVDRFWKEMMESRGGPDEMPTQTKMFDKEDYRIETDQTELF